MRIHIQNDPTDPVFEITQAQWSAAAARNNAPAHTATFGETAEDFTTHIADADIVIAQVFNLAGRFPCHAPNLKMIFCMSAGMDKLQPFSALPQGAVLVNNSGVHARKAGEYVAMAGLMLTAALPDMIANQHARRWSQVFRPSIRGRHATIVGTGDMGAAASRTLRALGVHTTGIRARALPHPDFDETHTADSLDAVLPRTHLLVLTAPLTEATNNLITRARLKLLPQGAGVINIGRGGVIDQDALCDLLDHGHLGGAVIDVFTHEPIPETHRLWTTKNLVITPHVSVDDPNTYNPDSLDIFYRNLKAWQNNATLPNGVDLTRGY